MDVCWYQTYCFTLNCFRQEAADQYAGDKTSLMSIDEIIVKLKDRMVQHKTSIRKAFQSYDPSWKGKIKKKDFRQVKFKYFYCYEIRVVAVAAAAALFLMSVSGVHR